MVGGAVGNTCRRVYTSLHGFVGYVQEEEIVALAMGEDVVVYACSNMGTWINESSRLSDAVLRFLCALLWKTQYA